MTEFPESPESPESSESPESTETPEALEAREAGEAAASLEAFDPSEAVLAPDQTEPFIGEIRAFGFNFAPRGWAACNGQLLSISSNTALFSILGTYYGGNGSTNFALPNLTGRAPMSAGQGRGLSQRFLGQNGGTDNVTLLGTEIPSHSHSLNISTPLATERQPAAQLFASGDGISEFGSSDSPTTLMWPRMVEYAGSSLPHNNMMPFLTMNYCIALEGVYPQRP